MLNWIAKRQRLAAHHVVHQPGLNEELAATAVFGSQLATTTVPGARYDGVLGMWYGKGPGVDRSGDAFKHANLAGVGRTGGVLALAGDDPSCKSSTVASASETTLFDALMPTIYPGNVQEILDLGLHGFALSRASGLLGGDEDRHQRRRLDRRGRGRSRRGSDPVFPTVELDGRALYPRARCAPPAAAQRRAGADPPLRASRTGAALRLGKQAEPDRRADAGCLARDHGAGEDLSRCAAGVGRTGPGRRRAGAPRHPSLADGDGLSGRAADRPRVRARPARDSGGRGEARLPRTLRARYPLQPAGSPDARRENRRGGAPAGAELRRTRPRQDRARDRRADRAQAGDPLGGGAAGRHRARQRLLPVGRRWCRSSALAYRQRPLRDDCLRRCAAPHAHGVLLLRLPAQPLDADPAGDG